MAFQVTGAERQRHLRRCRARIEQWGLKVPEREVLVLDFGLGEFEKAGLAEFWIANKDKAGYCGKFLFVFDGQACPAHYHKVKHETFYVVKGTAEMRAAGQTHLLHEGDVHAVAPGTVHSFTGRGDALLLEVSMPCLLGDSIFEDRRIGADGVI
jgi:N-acetylneuraminate synthase